MPGRKPKPKPKPKPLGPTKATRVAEELIKEVEDWPLIVRLLAAHYQLPDLSSKKGLKESYRKIDTISATLKEAFDGTSNLRLKGGIVGIWGKLAYDVIIRDNLIEYQDILKRVASILDKEETLVIALQTLATITRHSGDDIRAIVATAVVPLLVETLKTHTRNLEVTLLIITVFAHTVASIYRHSQPIYKRVPSIKMQDILPAVHIALCDDGPTPATFQHAKTLVMSATQHAHAALEKHQPSLDFIVACLRVHDLMVRATALSSILVFHLRYENRKPTIKFPRDAISQSAAIQNLPYHLLEAIARYGAMKCEGIEHMKAIRECFEAHMKAIQTKDFYALGLKLVELIYRSEYSMMDGWPRSKNELKKGMPYNDILDSMPVAAQALRERDPIKHAEAADILQVKYYTAKGRYEPARSISEAAMARNPQEVYWYYTSSTLEMKDDERKLRWAKRGLTCHPKSDYLRYCLLDNASHAAIQMAMAILETPDRPLQRSILALALLHSAKSDATAYVNEAPPDSRDLDEMLAILMCVTFVLKGKEVNPDLRELKRYQDHLKQADDFTRHLLHTFGPMQYRRAYDTIVERYERAAKFWDPRLENCNAHAMKHSNNPGDEYAPTEELQELFSSVSLDDNGNASPVNRPPSVSYMDTSVIRLYQCSFCGNCSATLRKCSRCAEARYCDPVCQKDHWKSHKPQCMASMSKSK